MIVANPFAAPEAFVALLIGAAERQGDAREAIAAAGGRIGARIDWSDVAAEIGQTAGSSILCIEAAGADTAVLEATLPRIDAVARTLDLCMIVSLTADQIDVVAAAILDRHAILLVDPMPADRLSALLVAAHRDDSLLADGVREGEAARLRRLNEEVARIAGVLARLTGETGLDVAGDVFDRRRGYDSGPAADGPVDAQWVRGAIRSRRMRDGFFGGNLFEDPAWDMLLDLFAAELEGNQVSVSSLCIASAVAPTTALRWIAKLTEAGLFVREPDPFDRRRAYLALTERASEGMRRYVSAVRHAGLPPG